MTDYFTRQVVTWEEHRRVILSVRDSCHRSVVRAEVRTVCDCQADATLEPHEHECGICHFRWWARDELEAHLGPTAMTSSATAT